MTELEHHEHEEKKRVCRCCSCGAWKAMAFGSKKVMEHAPCECGGNFVPVCASHTVRVINKLLDMLQDGDTAAKIAYALQLNGRRNHNRLCG